MKIKFQHLFRENYYKTLSAVCLGTGFALSSYPGMYVRDLIFNRDTYHVNLRLCFILLILGIMFVCLAVFFSLKIDQAKGVRKNES